MFKRYKIKTGSRGLHEMFGFERELYEDYFTIATIVLQKYWGKAFNEGTVLDEFITEVQKHPKYDISKPEQIALVGLICGNMTAVIRGNYSDFEVKGAVN